jgi:hypothetical protein
MLVYPQLPTGASGSSFRFSDAIQMRTLVNTAADGTSINWLTRGRNIGVATEVRRTERRGTGRLLQFFAAAEGTLNNFTFVDPTANLFAWSDDLSNAAWNAAPFLSSTGAMPIRRVETTRGKLDELRARRSAGLVANL